MQWLINLFRGFTTVTVWGAFPERLLNLCAQNGLGFWGLTWVDETTFRFTVSRRNYLRLRELAQRAMCELRRPTESGLPALARNLARRPAFAGGMALCIIALTVLSRFILMVDVQGNETIPTAVILEELSRQGLRLGVYGPNLEEKEISNAALIRLEGLSFLAVNLYGCRAQVQVREAEPAPELLNQNVPADIVSTADGILTRVVATTGQARFQKGDTVVAGDVLITGFMDLPEVTLSETNSGMYVVHSTGEVWARTWRTLRAKLPLTAQVKQYTGRETFRCALVFFNHRLNFYQNSGISYTQYDKISQMKTLTLPRGIRLPLSLLWETAREYTTQETALNRDAAISLLQEGLRRELDEILQATDGECLQTDYTASVEGDTLTVTLLAQCHEQIGKTVEREGKVGYVPGAGNP